VDYQDKLGLKSLKSMKVKEGDIPAPDGEDIESPSDTMPKVSKKELKEVLISVKGIGNKKYDRIIKEIGNKEEVVGVLEQSPSILLNIKGFTKNLVKKIEKKWEEFKNSKR